MAEINEVLDERGNSYGHYSDMALVAQKLKILTRSKTGSYSAEMQESIDMICTKLARLAVGDSGKIDTWQDIAGYALLIVRQLQEEKDNEAIPAVRS